MEVISDPDVKEFIYSLEKSTISKVLRMVGFLERFGQEIGMPYSKPISGGLFELRIRGKQEARIFYTFHRNAAYLLHGFVKKTAKTPAKEILRALSNKAAIDTL